MKLLLKQYLASLKERGELDVILPDILAESGYTVVSRPSIGTSQFGVDVLATGPHPITGETVVFLLSIKSGNLGRADWDDGKQALRPSLTDILDVYIPKFLPPRLKSMPMVIALCFGGDIKEDVRLRVTGFIEKNTEHGRIEFEEWNGDKIVAMISSGLLRENIFPAALQGDFRKSVAMIDEPSVCITHFRSLLRRLTEAPAKSQEARLRIARQIYLATWAVFAWSRDAGNLEAAYQAGALATLTLWDLCSPYFGRSKNGLALQQTVNKAIQFHQDIAESFIDTHVAPFATVRDGLAYSVPTNASVDVNLKLFETLGRVALQGLDLLRIRTMKSGSDEAVEAGLARIHALIAGIIHHNQTLSTPLRDDHAIEITLVGLLLMHLGDSTLLSKWLHEISSASIFSYRSNGPFPVALHEYADLAKHPQDTPGYKEDATVGSVLYPTLATWAALLGDAAMYRQLAEFRIRSMKHSTWQLWVPDEDTEAHLYRDTDVHGSAWTDIDFDGGPAALAEQLVDEANAADHFNQLSAVRLGRWPIVLMACRMHRLPIPPQFWFADPYRVDCKM